MGGFNALHAAAAVVLAVAVWVLSGCVRRLRAWQRRNYFIGHVVPRVQATTWYDWAFGALGAIQHQHRHRIIQRWGRELGLVFGYRFLWNHTIVVADPALCAELLGPNAWRLQGVDKSTQDLYGRLNVIWSPPSRPLGSMFTLPTGSRHRAVRRAAAPAFSTDNLRSSFPAVVDIVGQLVQVLLAARGAAVDVDAALRRESLDVIGKVGFGTDFGATRSLTETGGICAIFDLLQDSIAEGMARASNPFREKMWWTKSVRDGLATCQRFQEFMRGVVRDVQARGPPADGDMSLAALLMKATDPETGESLLDEDGLIAEFSMLMIAGVDTTSHTLAFFLYLVSQHPVVEARITEELAGRGLLSVAGSSQPRTLELNDTHELPYLSAALKESMRLMPTAGEGTFRVSDQDVQLGDLTIPAGTFIWAMFLNTFTAPELWDRPDEFLPDRWLDPEAEYVPVKEGLKGSAAGTQNGGAGRVRRFYPFSQGQRGCVGRGLAAMNYTAAAAVLLGTFHFRLADDMGGPEGVRAKEWGNLTLQVAGGVRMHCEPRGTSNAQ